MRKRLTKTIWYGSGVDSSGNPILPSANGGLDGLNYGELFLHLSNSKVTLWTLSSEGKIVEITGGGSDVDMSSYLLKSIWDKAFEFRTDKQGVEYIFSKLPVVAQYGITMYAGSDVNVPSLASGLPFDNKTIWYNPDTNQIEVIGGTGGGGEGGVSNFWDLSGIPSWITMSKPKYTYSEIEGTPDLSKYALGTELGKYVTLDTDQSLKGKKDFKNGLSIDGLELRKSQDDVIYIDANLVVRGGVTMYAQNEVDIPSIIDSIPTASTTVKGIASFDGNYFSVDANGKVSLISGSGGIDENELADYLNRNNYAKKSDIPSLVGYATQSWVNTRIDSLINGAPAAYDTLKEIADVLQGNVNSIGDIITALGTKWTQDNTKIANWDTAYSWGNHASAGYALKSYVDSTFVTLGSKQTITGEKNFTGGIKVNGSPIYYDSTKKYWKLEGDLLVTGGVTMYGSDSEFTPSTIMDAIQTDRVTIRVNPTTKNLEVIGNTSGATTLGGLSNVGNWADSVADVDRIMYQAAGSSNWVSKNLSDLELKGDYLPLSGGTLSGNLVLKSSTTSGATPKLYFQRGTVSDDYHDSYAYNQGGNFTIGIAYNGSSYDVVKFGKERMLPTKDNSYIIGAASYRMSDVNTVLLNGYTPITSNNISEYAVLASTYTASDVLSKLLTVDGSGSGLDADLLDGLGSSVFARNEYINNFITSGNEFNFVPSGFSSILWFNYRTKGGLNGNIKNYYFANGAGNTENVTLHAATFSGNSSSATKLETPRTIWGQSFDGSANVSGDLTLGFQKILGGNGESILHQNSSGYIQLGAETASKGYNTFINGKSVIFRYNTSNTEGMRLTSSGNVLIGTTTDSGYKLDVNGTIHTNSSLWIDTIEIKKSQDDVLYIDGNLVVRGGITMYGTNSVNVPTIMDAIATDNVNLKVVDGVLTFVGQTGGGVADSVAWANVTGKPTTLSGYGITDAKISNGVITLGGNTITPLTSHQTIYNLTLQAGSFSAVTFDPNGAAKTVNIPTTTSHISEGTNLYYTDARAQAAITGGASTITTSNLTKSRALISNSSGKVAVSAVTSTELGYLDGVTSAIQTQLNGKLSLAGGTINGSGSYSAIPLVIKNDNSSFIGLSLYSYNTERVHLGYWGSLGGIRLENVVSGSGFAILDNGTPSYYKINSDGTFAQETLWHSGNDGSGSGLDADLLDGVQESGFCRHLDGIPITSHRGIGYGFSDSGWILNGPALSIGYSGDNYLMQLQAPADYTALHFRNRMNGVWGSWKEIAFTDSNVASATKLQTARTVFGQSFDGSSDISGDIYTSSHRLLGTYGGAFLYAGIRDGEALSIEPLESNGTWLNRGITLLKNGNVGIGTPNPKDKLDVNGNIIATEYHAPTPSGGKYPKFRLISDQNSDSTWLQSANVAGTSASGILTLSGMYENDLALCKILGPLLVTHGITMYSDQRKKTILGNVELSLKDIANAPLIEHYYNSDINKTTHVGSIAQYWASMNDWFCKLDSEGFYTMEIQNCALASAISIARELDRYESKTDKTIKQLKKRICQLEEEVERLRVS